MAQVLNTNELNLKLEQMLTRSKKFIRLISPYIKINDRMKNLLLTKAKANLEITIIYGKNRDFNRNDHSNYIEESFIKELHSFDKFKLYWKKNLHAKIYDTDQESIVTSMNLYDYSQVNNEEIGVHFDYLFFKDKKPIISITKIIKNIIDGSELIELKAVNKEPVKKIENNTKEYEKLTIYKLAEQNKCKSEDLEKLFIQNGLITIKDNLMLLTTLGFDNGGEIIKCYGKELIVFPKGIIKS